MKKVFFTVFLALCCTMGFAQLSFNVKAGGLWQGGYAEDYHHRGQCGVGVGTRERNLGVAEQ